MTEQLLWNINKLVTRRRSAAPHGGVQSSSHRLR